MRWLIVLIGVTLVSGVLIAPLLGQSAGLSGEEILRITTGPSAPGWSALDAALLRAADELHLSRFVSDSTWNALAQRYTQDQLEGVVLIVGNYTQLTMFQNTLGAQLSPNIEGLPDSTAIR